MGGAVQMQVKTKTGSTVEIEDKDVIDFPLGLFGFEDYHKYVIVPSEYEPFLWLQSLDESGLAFIIIDPFIVINDYELDIDDRTLLEIGITCPADVLVLAVVTVPENGGPVTANLQGPLVVNRKNNKALQVILSDGKWTTKYDILKSLKEKGCN